MSQPTPYAPSHEFLTDETANPNFPGSEIDIELNAIDTTLDQILTNLALIQRDDGALANGIVTVDSLDPVLAAALGDVASLDELLGLGREKLTEDIVIYISNDGDPSNDGRTEETPLLTAQNAIDLIKAKIDLATHNITIQCADGTYDSFVVNGPWVGGENSVTNTHVTIKGNASTPANVLFTGTETVTATGGGRITLDSLAVESTSGTAIIAQYGGMVRWKNTIHGNTPGAQFRAVFGGQLAPMGDFSLRGTAVNLFDNLDGIIRCSGRTITCIGTPAYTDFFRGRGCGTTFVDATWVGSVTGAECNMVGNSVVDLGSSTLPSGLTAGTISEGAIFNGNTAITRVVVPTAITGANTNDASSGSGSFVDMTPTATIPANFIKAGRSLRVTVLGKLTTGSTAPPLNLRMKLGSTVVGQYGPLTPAANQTDKCLSFAFMLVGLDVPGAAANTATAMSGQNNQFTGTTVINSISQPVALATNGALTLAIGSKWDTAGTGTSTFIVLALIVEAVN